MNDSPQLLSVFSEALELPSGAERATYLDRACGNDADLRARVEDLLRAHERAPHFLEGSPPQRDPGATVDRPPVTERPGAVIGPYKLLQQIGEGGMGTVFLAEQTQPVQRMVALKVIKPGMDSRQVIARFEAERQALAMMDHVNIARVFDGGSTESGRPYFVMELVHGVPITRYCDDNHLTPRERLELFVPVCQAIQHAHQKGIIHRDIKPSNVMVTLYDGKPVPKVIDFGVAKATEQKMTERTLFTQYGTMVGTLEYMSPEQAEMSALGVDTRSDIYSLGVLLYELLTGSTPLTHKRMKEAAYAEILRMIKEEEPPRPSTRLSDSGEALASISANRHTEPAKLTKLVKGELDWIVMKCLDKDRNRRYETANGFAADVQRYLADEPVLACPPSAAYRLRKFVRRNKRTLVTAALVGVMLLAAVGAITGTLGWAVRDRSAREAEAVRRQAERQAKIAGQVELIFGEVDRLEREHKWAEALAAARRAEAAVTGGEADAGTAQRVRALLKDLEFIDRLEQIRMQWATSVEKMDYAGADREYARAFRDYGVDALELAVETSIDRLKARPGLAIPLAVALDDWVSARRVEVHPARWKQLVAVARGIDPEPLRDRLRSAWGQPVSEVQDELRRLADSIDIRAQHPTTLVSLARTLQDVKHPDSALRVLRDAQFVYPGDFWLNFELGYVLLKGDAEGASRFNTAAVSIRPNSAAAYNNLGTAMRGQKKLPEAIAAFRKAIELDPKNAKTHSHLGFALQQHGKLDEAIDAFKEAIRLKPDFASGHYSLGVILRDSKHDYEGAIACFNKYIDLELKSAGAHNELGLALEKQGKLDKAIGAYRKAIELAPKFALAYSNLCYALRSQNKLDEAIAELRQLVTLEKKMAAASPHLTHFQMSLAVLLNDRAWQLVTGDDPKSRDPKRAIDLAHEGAALFPNGTASPKTLGVAHYRAGNWKAAVEELVKCRHSKDSAPLFFLSMAHGRLNEKEQARALFEEAAQWRMGFGVTEKELRRLCAEAADLLGLEIPPTLKEPPVLTPGPTLLKPAAGATLDNGYDPSKSGVWEFDWSDVPGATQYHLYLFRPTSKMTYSEMIFINNPTFTLSSSSIEAKRCIVDFLLLDRRWKVRALVNGIWTDWSEERTFAIAPLDDSKPASPKK